jgi:glycine/D-amino acid oxidase-like deaminating enzyme
MNISVIGGGVIGVSCALSLARAGVKVRLFTEKELGSGASGRSLSWLNASGPWPADYYNLRMAGIDRFRSLYCKNTHVDWLKFNGGVFLSDQDEVRKWYSIEKERGYDSHLFQPEDVNSIDAKINPAAMGPYGIYNAGEGWVSLPELIECLVSEFLTHNGTVIENAGKTVPIFDAEGATKGVVSQKQGEYLCDKVLLACGASTSKLLAELGVDLPDGSVLSMVAITEPSDNRPSVVLNTPKVAMRPNPGNSLVIDHSWYVNEIKEDENGVCSVPEHIVEQLLSEADRLLISDVPITLAGYKAGWKPVPADGFPVLGELQEMPGCYVAFTHSGATLSLIVGELVSWEMTTGKSHPMLASFRPGRFKS